MFCRGIIERFGGKMRRRQDKPKHQSEDWPIQRCRPDILVIVLLTALVVLIPSGLSFYLNCFRFANLSGILRPSLRFIA